VTPVDTFSRIYLENPTGREHGLSAGAETALNGLRQERAPLLDRPYNRRWWRNAARLEPPASGSFAVDEGTVRFGRPGDLDEGAMRVLYGALADLKSWRKGPFNYAGIEVDAEWRSDLKWTRVMELIRPEIGGRRIADVGCNNLYYVYRMLEHDPALVVGLEPVERYFFYHYLNTRFYRDSRIRFELFGIDDLALYGPFFDLVFCMGILYHRRNPLLSLENLAAGMRPGGELVLETAGIPGDGELCLFPGRRYMKAPGWWFLPAAGALVNMLDRSGFEEIKIHGIFPLTVEEQRRTDWVDTQSLEHFLDPDNPSRTVEGYPAPVRIYASARRRS
jgi:tRNA (mo5U34)-methyltransferase